VVSAIRYSGSQLYVYTALNILRKLYTTTQHEAGSLPLSQCLDALRCDEHFQVSWLSA
jgi:hypothetical protein